jgi:hypothetical protein
MNIDISTLNVGYEPCVACKTPVKLLSINLGSTILNAWYECTYEEGDRATEITFVMHTSERCQDVSGANLVPCRECGTPVEFRLPQPADIDAYGGNDVYDEGWVKRDGTTATRDWHSPGRCAAARSREDTADKI